VRVIRYSVLSKKFHFCCFRAMAYIRQWNWVQFCLLNRYERWVVVRTLVVRERILLLNADALLNVSQYRDLRTGVIYARTVWPSTALVVKQWSATCHRPTGRATQWWWRCGVMKWASRNRGPCRTGLRTERTPAVG